jgi:septal ring factor EnvC (AmiA/AmiB activator)
MTTTLTKLALPIFILSLAWPTPSWSAASNREQQKNQATSEQAELHKKLDSLKQAISNTESAKQHAADNLAESEKAISQTNRKLNELSNKRQKIQQKLSELILQQQQLQQQIEQQKKQFSSWLRQEYQTGNADRIKLILSGDNPNRINRELQYLGYLSASQSKLINQLQENLVAVEKNKQETEQTKQELDDIALEQQQQKSYLVQEQAKRAALIKQLASKLTAQKKQAGQLQKDEQRLANLINKLTRQIEAQRKEKKRQAGSKAAAKNRQSTAAPIIGAPEIGMDHSQFAKLKGHLRLPIQGELITQYNQQRGEGAKSKGLFIHANEGVEIKSIAKGKVVFADWLRGFGNLIILDHGDKYMSIYGNNQSLLKQVGATVNTGETIATVGNSGDNEQSGLYFELRYQGKAFNPLGWMTSNN